jgi:hypothetical protein
MKKCYAALWMPTIHHHLPYAIESYCEKNISDQPEEPLHVEVILKKDSGDIEIKAWDNNSEGKTKTKNFELKQEEVSRDGMILYSYEAEKYDENQKDGFRFTEEHFPKSIYHIIKSFYHRHRFHAEDEDAILTPYTSEDYIDINSENNAAVLHYLNMYEDFLDGIINNINTIENNSKGVKYKTIVALYTKAKGYDVHLNALYYSQNNTKCRLDNKTLDEPDQKWHRCAFNIENSMEFLETVERKYGINHQFDITKQARYWAKAGFIVGAIGLLMSVIALIKEC